MIKFMIGNVYELSLLQLVTVPLCMGRVFLQDQ